MYGSRLLVEWPHHLITRHVMWFIPCVVYPKVLAHGLHHPYDSRLWVIWHSLSPFDWRLHVSASASLSIGLNKEVTYVVVYNMASLTHAHVLCHSHQKVDLTQWFTAATQWFTAAKGGPSLHMATVNSSCSNSTSLLDLGWWDYLTRGGAVHSREGSR